MDDNLEKQASETISESEFDSKAKSPQVSKLLSLPFSLLKIPLPVPSYLMVGFLLIAGGSAWLNLEQARTVDSIGDVLSVDAEIKDLNRQISTARDLRNDPETKEESKKGLNKDIEELNNKIGEKNKELAIQRQDVAENTAGLLNGSFFWSFLIQVGAAAFGIGIINIITCKKTDSRVRSAGLIVIGSVVIFLLLSRILTVSAYTDLIKF